MFSRNLKSPKEPPPSPWSRRWPLKMKSETVPAGYEYSHCIGMAEPCSSCASDRVVPRQGRCRLSHVPDHSEGIRADLFQFLVFGCRGIAAGGGRVATARYEPAGSRLLAGRS